MRPRIVSRPVHDGRRNPHRHQREFTPRDIAAWFGCPACQRGRPLVLTRTSATAISTILTTLTKGATPP